MKNKIIKNTIMLYLMNFAKMVFPLLTLPYLTRVLSVNCYGNVAYVKSVMQYIQIIIDFGFLLSGTRNIILAGTQNKLNWEVSSIFFAKIILSMLAAVVLFIATCMIPILQENILYTWLSFVVVFLTNFLFDFLFRGLEKMEIITIRFVIMRGIATLLTFVFIKGDSDILWIPILDIIGSIIAIVFVIKEIQSLKIQIIITPVIEALKRLRDSAIYFFSNMATTAFMALNTVIIGIFLNSNDVAYWSVCLQISTAVQALYTPLTDGIYPHMVKTRNLRVLTKAVKIYMPIISIGCIFTFGMANYILLLLGGNQYTEAANVLRALIPVLFFSFLSMLFGWPALGAIGKQNETTLTTVLTAIIQIVGLFLLVFLKKFNLINIALLRGFTEFLLFIFRLLYVIKFRKVFSK